MPKPKVALYWAASCGGCEIAVLEIGEKILDLAEAADIVFWPVAADFKYSDVEAMPDQSIDVTLFNGAIQSTDNEHAAKLLRRKSKTLIAYGACASQGGIPGLANFTDPDSILKRAYIEAPSNANPQGVMPQATFQTPEGELTLPTMHKTVRTLAQTVDVDYFIPGCPPVGNQTWAALEAVLTGNLPTKGSVVGAGSRALCEECTRVKEEKKVKAFHRPHEIMPDGEKCLLEQGLLCLGAATREGCGALCPKVNMPCTGCYGPLDGVLDQGARILSAVSSVIDSNDPQEVARIVDMVKDPAGTFYRYSLPASMLRRARVV